MSRFHVQWPFLTETKRWSKTQILGKTASIAVKWSYTKLLLLFKFFRFFLISFHISFRFVFVSCWTSSFVLPYPNHFLSILYVKATLWVITLFLDPPSILSDFLAQGKNRQIAHLLLPLLPLKTRVTIEYLPSKFTINSNCTQLKNHLNLRWSFFYIVTVLKIAPLPFCGIFLLLLSYLTSPFFVYFVQKFLSD